MNNRRKLVIALGAGTLAAALTSFGQQLGKIWRIGFLSPRSRPASIDSVDYGLFAPSVRERGYVEGKNLLIEWRAAEGKLDRLPGFAAELVQLKVDVIVAIGPQATEAAQKATTAIPIVMVVSNDPVAGGDGLADKSHELGAWHDRQEHRDRRAACSRQNRVYESANSTGDR